MYVMVRLNKIIEEGVMRVRKRILHSVVFCAIIGIVIFRLFVYDYMFVQGNSMNEAYKVGDIVLLEKRCSDLKRFDVVIIKINNVKMIKRVIGLPKETVQILDGNVYINNKKLEDDIVDIKIEDAGIASSKIDLAADEYFLLGDNRNESEDSRSDSIGIIKKEQIVGKVFFKL